MNAVMTPEAPSAEPALVDAARAGDDQAREALGRKAGRSAYVFALQLTGDADAALDLAQDAVAGFFRSLDRFDGERPIEPWLYQIVRNKVRDRARRDRVRRAESLDALLESGQSVPASSGDDPAVDVERAALQRRIWQAVSELSDAHREIFVLRDYHGLTYRQIAETLSIPEGTVMSRLHAARTSLRTLLAPERRPDDPATQTDERSDR